MIIENENEESSREINRPNEIKKDKIVMGIDLINLIENEPEPKILWNGIPEDSVGLITGIGKTGKTTFCENLATSIAVGRTEFFGHKLEGTPRKVMFVNMEEPFRLTTRRNKRQLKRLDENELQLWKENYISIPTDFPSFLNEEKDWLRLRNYILDYEPDVLFIDSLSSMCVGEIEKSYVAQSFLQKFREYIEISGMTTIVVHHNTKDNRMPADQSNIAGSRFITQFFEFAYTLAKVPFENGGQYGCMVYNKYSSPRDEIAELYYRDDNDWIFKDNEKNKFTLYKPSPKRDGRYDETSPNLIYDFMENTYSQGNQIITTSTLKEALVYNEDKTMSLDTLHNSINRLVDNKMIKKVKKGLYTLNKRDDRTGDDELRPV